MSRYSHWQRRKRDRSKAQDYPEYCHYLQKTSLRKIKYNVKNRPISTRLYVSRLVDQTYAMPPSFLDQINSNCPSRGKPLAFITGATGGIGSKAAQLFSEKGHGLSM